MSIQQDHGADQARQALAETRNNGVVANTRPTLRELVASQQGEIARALALSDVDAARYVRIVQTELRKNPKLMECSPESFLGAVLTAAQLKLEFGPMQQAYLVPYGREIQLIIGYKGWLTLMNRSAEIQSVSARTVYERDTFEIEYGLDENLIHKPASGDRGKPVAYYAVIRKTNGGRSFAVMTHAEVIKHRDRYGKKGGKLIGPWADPDQFEAMAFKTVFLKAKTWVPTSVETQVAQDMDTRVVKRMTVDQEPEIVPDDDVVDAEIVDTETGEVKSQADLEDEEWIAQARGDDA